MWLELCWDSAHVLNKQTWAYADNSLCERERGEQNKR